MRDDIWVRAASPVYSTGAVYVGVQRNEVRTCPWLGQAMSKRLLVMKPPSPRPHQPVAWPFGDAQVWTLSQFCSHLLFHGCLRPGELTSSPANSVASVVSAFEGSAM